MTKHYDKYLLKLRCIYQKDKIIKKFLRYDILETRHKKHS